MSDLLYQLRGVGFSYSDTENTLATSQKFIALHPTDLQIRSHEFIAIVGASGSGKTTLMNMLGLLAKPTMGALGFAWANTIVNTESLAEEERALLRNREIGFVFQQFALLSRLSVIENILLPFRFDNGHIDALNFSSNRQRPQTWGEVTQRARALLRDLGLEGLEDRLPTELSGGQKQRVAICRALIMNPSILLADEPTGALDSATTDEILNLLETLSGNGITIIIITHDAHVASRARRQITLRDGRIISDELSALKNLDTSSPQGAPGGAHHSLDHHQTPQTAQSQSSTAPFKFGNSVKCVKFALTLFKIFQSALSNLWSNRLRSSLTGLGLALGVASIILISGLGILAQNVFNALFYNAGTSKIYVFFDRDKSAANGVRYWQGMDIHSEFPEFASRFSKYGKFRPFVSTDSCNIQTLSQPARAILTGVFDTDEFQEMDTPPSSGRFPNALEITSGARVAVLGSDTVDAFFKKTDAARTKATFPIGEKIFVSGCEVNNSFTIIGVLGKRDTMFTGRDANDKVYTPAQALLGSMNSTRVRFFSILPNRDIDARWLGDHVTNYLQMRAGINTFFTAAIPAELIEKVRFFLFIIQSLTGFIGALCIIVGGIGIMNIMIVTVTERVREIGIMKSQGATPAHIRWQFVIESITLCLFAGVSGVFAGLILTHLISLGLAFTMPKTGGFQLILSFWGLALGLIVSFASGIGFGYLPALKASRMEPADCMRED